MLRLECLRCSGEIYITTPREGLDVTCMCGAEYTLTRGGSSPEWWGIALAGAFGFMTGLLIGPWAFIYTVRKMLPPR